MRKGNATKLPASNDNIPEDEMDLACAIAETKARGLKGTVGAYYRTSSGSSHGGVVTDNDAACCAIGALALCLGNIDAAEMKYPFAVIGNDNSDLYEGRFPLSPEACTGLTLGSAFAHAMDVVRVDGKIAE